jgi:hypothetical protein
MNQREEEMQRTLMRFCAELRDFDARLGQLCKSLPEPAEGSFNARAELRGLLECVRTDLLEDATSTLRVAARRGEAEWRHAYDERAQLLVRLYEAEAAFDARRVLASIRSDLLEDGISVLKTAAKRRRAFERAEKERR